MTQPPRSPWSRWWRWRPRQGRDLITVSIERGADADGCAICWVLASREHRSLWILLRENILDPGTRSDWNRTLGFCARHTSALCATASRMGQLPGVAILFGDSALEAARRIGAGAPLHVWRDCLECRREAQSEAAHIRRLKQHLGDAGWTERWAPSLRLCVDHAAPLRATGGGGAGAVVSLTAHLRALAAPPGEHDDERSPRSSLAALSDALLGFASPEGIPALPRWGCAHCDAEATAVVQEGRRLFRDEAILHGAICRRHAGLLLASSEVTPTQLAVHYAVALGEAADALEQRAQIRGRAKGLAVPTAPCPLCVFVDAHAHEIAASAAPGGSGAALCLRHTEAAMERPAGGATSSASRAAHVEVLRALSHELFELHRKSSWDARNEPKGSEETSWIRAAHYLTYDTRAQPLTHSG